MVTICQRQLVEMNLENIKQAVSRVKRYHEQLVVLCGDACSQQLVEFSSVENLPMVNVGLELAALLLEVPSVSRPKVAANIFEDLILQKKSETVLLVHLEILFDRSLSIDPLKLLKKCSKNITLVVVWPGVRSGSSLIYAMPNHPEYRFYKESDLVEIVFVEAN